MSYKVLNLAGKRLNESFDYKAEFEKTGNKKYILDTDDTKETRDLIRVHTYYRIIYKDGSKGGWLESYENLSQDGHCKVLDEATVGGNAKVYQNAQVYGEAEIGSEAKVYGNAQIYGRAWIVGNAKVYGNAQVYGNAWVRNNAQVYENAKIYGKTEVYDRAKVFGSARICEEATVAYDVSEGEITE